MSRDDNTRKACRRTCTVYLLRLAATVAGGGRTDAGAAHRK